MNTEFHEMHATVREGYQILLRAEAVLRMPTDRARIRDFYERVANTCMKWAVEVCGERLRNEFLALDGVRERSGFRTRYYRFDMRYPWENGKHAAVLCETRLTGAGEPSPKGYYRISHVWNLEEETALPFSQILRTFGVPLDRHTLPFRPDGIYPEGEEMVFFRNANDQNPFAETRLPRKS